MTILFSFHLHRIQRADQQSLQTLSDRTKPVSQTIHGRQLVVLRVRKLQVHVAVLAVVNNLIFTVTVTFLQGNSMNRHKDLSTEMSKKDFKNNAAKLKKNIIVNHARFTLAHQVPGAVLVGESEMHRENEMHHFKKNLSFIRVTFKFSSDYLNFSQSSTSHLLIKSWKWTLLSIVFLMRKSFFKKILKKR